MKLFNVMLRTGYVHTDFAAFLRPWDTCSAGRVNTSEVTTEDVVQFVCDFLEQAEVIALPLITGEDLYHVARRKKSSAGRVGWLDFG